MAQMRVQLSSAEKRVKAEREAARKHDIYQLEHRRSSPANKTKLAELLRPQPDTSRNVMVLHPNQSLDYGQLLDVRSETIGHAILQPEPLPGADAVAAGGADVKVKNSANNGCAPSTDRFAHDGVLSLAEWWEHASGGACRWSVSARCTVRVAVVRLHRPPMIALFPVDQVWRSEAYVPWEVDAVRRNNDTGADADATVQCAADVPAAAVAASSAAALAAPGPPAVPSVAPLSRSLMRTFSVRDSFIAAPGYLLLSVDYSNIELRLMAHFSKDPSLMQLFNDQGRMA